MKINKLIRSLIFLLALSMAGAAWADLELRISKTSNRGIPIVIAPIAGGAHAIIEADLNRSGRFKIVSSQRATNLATFGSTLRCMTIINLMLRRIKNSTIKKFIIMIRMFMTETINSGRKIG